MLAHKNAQRFRYTPLDSLSRKLLSFHSAISLALALARVFSHKRLGTMRILGPAMVLINETPCVGNTFSPRNLAKPSIDRCKNAKRFSDRGVARWTFRVIEFHHLQLLLLLRVFALSNFTDSVVPFPNRAL